MKRQIVNVSPWLNNVSVKHTGTKLSRYVCVVSLVKLRPNSSKLITSPIVIRECRKGKWLFTNYIPQFMRVSAVVESYIYYIIHSILGKHAYM